MWILNLILIGLTANAAPINEMGAKLISLRAEVEENGQRLQEVQRESSGKLDVYIQRRTELETQVSKAGLRTLQLQEKRKQLLKNAGSPTKANASEFTELLTWAGDLEKSVRESLPFRRTERLQVLAALTDRIKTQRESSVSLAGELWVLTEKEFKLSADNEYLIGKIELDGIVQEAEIARIGMVQMMFKTADGKLGYAARQDNGWKLVTANTTEVNDAISRTLGKFKNRQSSGWFEVPGIASAFKGGQ